MLLVLHRERGQQGQRLEPVEVVVRRVGGDELAVDDEDEVELGRLGLPGALDVPVDVDAGVAGDLRAEPGGVLARAADADEDGTELELTSGHDGTPWVGCVRDARSSDARLLEGRRVSTDARGPSRGGGVGVQPTSITARVSDTRGLMLDAASRQRHARGTTTSARLVSAVRRGSRLRTGVMGRVWWRATRTSNDAWASPSISRSDRSRRGDLDVRERQRPGPEDRAFLSYPRPDSNRRYRRERAAC